MKRVSGFFASRFLCVVFVIFASVFSLVAQDLKGRPQGGEILKLNGTFAVSADEAFAKSEASAITVADLNGDGIKELITVRENRVSVQAGNVGAFAPQTQAEFEAIRDLRFISPFHSEADTFDLPIAPDFLFAGDFNRDGLMDILAAARGGGSIFLVEGDGSGGHCRVREIQMSGAITAISTGDANRADGMPDVMVGTDNDGEFRIAVYQGLGDVFNSEPEVIELKTRVNQILSGQFDDNSFNDIAVAAGNELIIFGGHETGSTKPDATQIPQSFAIRGVATGDFIPDRDFRSEFALLGDDGYIRILSRGDLDTRPVSKTEQLAIRAFEMMKQGMPIPQRISKQIDKKDLKEKPESLSTGATGWNEADSFFGASQDNLTASGSTIIAARLSNRAGDDIVVLNPAERGIKVLPLVLNDDGVEGVETAYEGKRGSVKFDLDSAPLAVVAGRFNFDGDMDLIILEDGKSTPAALFTAPEAAFTVNNAGDAVDANPGNGVCATSGAVCTLRAAIMEANHLAGTDSITINAGINITLSTGSPDNDANGVFNFEGGGDLDITCAVNAGGDTCNAPLASNVNNLTITGAAGGNTIAVGAFAPFAPLTSTTDRVFDIGMDGLFGGGFGAGTGLQVTMSNLTIQSGNVREDFNAGGGGYANFARGGAIRIDGFGPSGTRGTLTLTNVVVNNNQADHNSGGIFNQFANVSISSSTVSNNIGKAGPGGGLQFAASTPATLSVSGSTFSGNEARTGPVFSGTAIDVDGGGIYATLDNNTATITSTNFTSNISHDDGGGLYVASGATTVSSGTMSGNTSRDDGGFAAGDSDTVSAARFMTLSSVTIRSNTANSDASGGGDGGGVFRDRGTLNVSNCFIGTVALPNAAVNGGGIAHAFRAAVNPTNVTTVNVDNGSIVGNNATTTGGGTFFDSTNNVAGDPSDLNVGATTSVLYAENNANLHGGGIAIAGGANGNLTRAFIHGNDADKDNNASGDGGGVFTSNGTVTIPNTSSIGTAGQGNTGENGGAIHHIAGTLTITGTPISNNTTDVHGGALTVVGGTANVNGVTFAANTSTSGTEVRLTGGTTNFIGGITIPGELSIAGGTLSAGSSTVNLGEDFHFSSGTFTAGTSTFNFNGAAAQQIYGGAVPTFNNLTDANTAAQLSVNNNANVNNELTIVSNATLNPAATSVIGGTGTLMGTGTARVTRTAVTADFLSQYTITNKLLSNLLVDYVGSAAQTISALTYGGLRLNNASGATLAAGTTTVGGTLFLASGNLGVSTNTLVVNNGITVTSGTFSSAATGTFNYNQGSNGQVVLPGNYGNLTFSNFNKVLPVTTVGIARTFTTGSAVGHTVTGSNINFNGTTAQIVPVFPYEGLAIANAAGASLGGNVTVNGALGLVAGVLAVGTNTLTLNSTVAASSGSLSSGVAGTVNYNQGSNGQTVLAANYGNLTFSNFNKTLPSSTVGIAGTFTTGSATGHTITGNTINFNSAGAQTIPAFQYNNLTSGNIGGRTLANSGTISVAAVFTPGTNAYTVTGSTINFNGAGAQGIPASIYNNLTTSTGGVKTTSGAVNVSGNATVGAGTTLVVASGSTFSVAGTLTNNNTIQGLGTIGNNFSNGGILAPGLSPGILNVTGTFANSGSLNIEIGGTGGAGVNPNGHDQLLVSGAATIGGTLNVTLTNGFNPVIGNSFVFFDAASLTGTFATTNLPAVAPNNWDLAYNPGAGTVTLTLLGPTAANVSVSGRVQTNGGQAIGNARIVVTDSQGIARSVRTNSFGNYRIDDLEVGGQYIVNVNARTYTFTSRIISPVEDVVGFDFVADVTP